MAVQKSENKDELREARRHSRSFGRRACWCKHQIYKDPMNRSGNPMCDVRKPIHRCTMNYCRVVQRER